VSVVLTSGVVSCHTQSPRSSVPQVITMVKAYLSHPLPVVAKAARSVLDQWALVVAGHVEVLAHPAYMQVRTAWTTRWGPNWRYGFCAHV